jgi:hypothetical protein
MPMFIRKGSPKALASALFLILVFVFGLFVESYAQEWRIGQGQRFSISQASSSPLRVRSSGKASLSSFGFVGKVGGINFEKIASPSTGQLYQNISLIYDQSMPDGQRLTVVIDNNRYNAMLPDWQLIPIARYANSDYTAVVSLFGDGPDRNRYYYIQYHEAFKNTLLGLRLLQADILFIDLNNNWDLPRFDNRLVMGVGEAVPDESSSAHATQRIDQILQNHTWRSWVLTDIETSPQFSGRGGNFQVIASPYYYFWDIDKTPEELIKLAQELESQYNYYKSQLVEYNSKVADYNASRDVNTRNNLKYELNTQRIQIKSLETNLKKLKNQLDNPSVRGKTELTAAMRSESKTLKQYNPSVYNACVNTAAYSAFFRYVKKYNPVGWNNFIKSISNVTVSPSLQTPTTWER